ncbi:MAG: hypothetical protein WAX38_00155, partial [Minisyncoccia bacterium]
TYYHPRIGFTSTEPIVPELLKKTFGGSVFTHAPKNLGHKLVYLWAVGTADAGRIANDLLPYLRLKSRQAEMVIQLCQVIETQHKEQRETQKPPYRITPEQLVKREELWEGVTKLNQPRNRRVHHVGSRA